MGSDKCTYIMKSMFVDHDRNLYVHYTIAILVCRFPRSHRTQPHSFHLLGCFQAARRFILLYFFDVVRTRESLVTDPSCGWVVAAAAESVRA